MLGVLVIGGGPSGASFATRMAQLGHDVTLVESMCFPRHRLGESLTPGVPELLSATGAWRWVEQAGFPPAREVRQLWESESISRINAAPGSLLIDRGRFDILLLAHAAREGVRVLQPAKVVSCTSDAESWTVLIEHDGGRESIHAGFLADARGRQAGISRRAMGERTLALFADWDGAAFPSCATVAAGESGWFWGLPLPGGRYMAQAFLSPHEFHGAKGESLEQRYRRLIQDSALGVSVTSARLMGAVKATDATPYLALEPVTPRMIRLGDAAISLDPISSSGMQKAIQTALSGAIVANTLLRRPEASAIACDFYRTSLSAAAERHRSWVAERYHAAGRARNHPFWTARAKAPAELQQEYGQSSPSEEVILSRDARLFDCPCLGAEFVELHRALVHPALSEPVAFLAEQPLATLLSSVPRGSLVALARYWSRHMPFKTAMSIAVWLRRKGVLVPAGDQRMEAAA
jgi:2-polyprenyl-6-methoxyphenol hydroxylase-like FAD-dependent oxidoreductase